jgi:hypothetical protein
MVLGPDRQPLHLPLDTTEDDLNDILGPGSYRLEAVDEAGELLDCVVCAGVGGLQRERAASEMTAAPVGATAARTSDLRVVMEANVQMARSLADAVRVLSEAQADWTKALATAKAIPRNARPVDMAPASPMAWTPPPPQMRSDGEDGEEYEPTWYERMVTSIPPQFLPGVINAVGDFVDRFVPRAGEIPMPEHRNAAPDDDGDDHEPEAEPGPAPLTPELIAKIEAVKAQLTPDELRLVMHVLATAGPSMFAGLARELGPLSVDQAVERVRTMIAGSKTNERGDDR